MVNRYEAGIGEPYRELLEIVEDKDYFVLTTNVDHQFQLAGFDKKAVVLYAGATMGMWQMLLNHAIRKHMTMRNLCGAW